MKNKKRPYTMWSLANETCIMSRKRRELILKIKFYLIMFTLIIVSSVYGYTYTRLIESIGVEWSVQYKHIKHLPVNEDVAEIRPLLSLEAQWLKSEKENKGEWDAYYKMIDVCPNNNPGNLVFAGQPSATKSGRWAVFPNIRTGYRALLKQIELDTARGDTIETFMKDYAPSFENDTVGYVNFLVKETGENKNTKLKDLDGIGLSKAIIKMECKY